MESHGVYVAGTDDSDSAACGSPCEIPCELFNKLISIKLHITS